MEASALSPSLGDGYGLPAQLAACASRHQQHLGALIGSFRALGMDEETIEGHVRQLVSSYEKDLLEAFRETFRGRADA